MKFLTTKCDIIALIFGKFCIKISLLSLSVFFFFFQLLNCCYLKLPDRVYPGSCIIIIYYYVIKTNSVVLEKKRNVFLKIIIQNLNLIFLKGEFLNSKIQCHILVNFQPILQNAHKTFVCWKQLLAKKSKISDSRYVLIDHFTLIFCSTDSTS